MKKDSRSKKRNSKKNIIKVFVKIIIATNILLLYARFIGTSGLIIKEHRIYNSNIPDSFHGTKIIHVSDIHYGRVIQKERLNELVDKINELKPDIVVFTGDLIDKDTKLTKKDKKILIEALKKIDTNINKYAITGNHDHQFKAYDSILLESDFVNLNDSYDVVYNKSYEPIMIAGLKTYKSTKKSMDDRMININNYIADNKDTGPKYRILLMHEPDLIDEVQIDNFNLVLAGHSHNGQVRLPFIGATILPPKAKKYYKEYYSLGNTDLYISSGVGTSTINFRFLNRPSINLYRLVNK
jgi:predicted MPP superfamily phosphohydrolase